MFFLEQKQKRGERTESNQEGFGKQIPKFGDETAQCV